MPFLAMEDLANLCEGLKLTEEEQQEFNLSEEDILQSQDFINISLVTLVVSKKEVNKGAFKATMAKVWQSEGNLTFKDIGRNKFLIECSNMAVKKRILLGQPWSFDRNLLSVQDTNVSRASLSKT